MAITLTTAFLEQVKKVGKNQPNTIVEIDLTSAVRWLANGSFLADGSITAEGDDGGTTRTVKWGFAHAGFDDVKPILKSVSSLSNKLDVSKGWTNRGELTVVIAGRDNFISMLSDEFLKNRRVIIKEGFVAPGFLYSDYAETFTGKILDWRRKGDRLSLTIGDDMRVSASIKLPVENETKTQTLDYKAMNPVDIMLEILDEIGVPAAQIDTARFEDQKNTWLSGWVFDRVLTKPEKATQYLAELQLETNSFIIQDGEKISLTYFGPPTPGEIVPLWTDDDTIDKDSLSVDSGYRGRFFNRFLFLYDYDEDGEDKFESYSSVRIDEDAASQTTSEWEEVVTKTIKSRWMRTITYTSAINTTGVTIYHVSKSNGIGDGNLTFNFVNNTLSWNAPNDGAGTPVKLTKDGKYQIFSSDTTKYVRVTVDRSSLPGSGMSDNIVITSINGDLLASILSSRSLKRYRDPIPQVDFSVDINKVSMEGTFIKPTDMVDLSSGEIAYKSNPNVERQRFMIVDASPDFTSNKIKISALKAGLPSDDTRRFAFISPASFPDYPSATEAQREYAFIGDINNLVNGGAEDGYYIW